MKINFSKYNKQLFQNYIKENETYDFFPYGYKFEEKLETMYLLARFRVNQKTYGGLVITESGEVVENRELAVKIAMDMVNYNRSIHGLNGAINDMRSRPYKKLIPLIKSLSSIREEIKDTKVKESFSNIINSFQKIVDTSTWAAQIYEEMKRVDDTIYEKTGYITNEIVKKMRDFVLEFNQRMYEESKTQLQYWNDHLIVLEELDKRKFPLSKWLEIRQLRKQLKTKHSERGYGFVLSSLEEMEKDYFNNLITEARGTLTVEEYTSLIQENERRDMEENGVTKVRN